MKFALLGAGAIAQLRKRAIDTMPEASFAGVFDLDRARAASLAGGGAVFDSLEALAASEAEAVIVSTPPDTHEALAAAVLRAGKHVIVEKPMANSPEACARMIALAAERQRVLTVGFNHRYFPAVKAMRDAITSGSIGALSHVRGYAGHAGLAEFKAQWMYDKEVMGGGALLDNGIHMIDLVQHVMGPVRQVYGKALDKTWGLDRVEDNGYAILTGDNGVIGTLGASWTEWKGYHFHIEAYGTHGMARASYAPMMSSIITMDRPGGVRKTRRNFYPALILREKLQGWQSTALRTLAEEMRDFIALVQGRAGGRIASAADGLRAIQIAQAVYASSAGGGAVTLPGAA